MHQRIVLIDRLKILFISLNNLKSRPGGHIGCSDGVDLDAGLPALFHLLKFLVRSFLALRIFLQIPGGLGETGVFVWNTRFAL